MHKQFINACRWHYYMQTDCGDLSLCWWDGKSSTCVTLESSRSFPLVEYCLDVVFMFHFSHSPFVVFAFNSTSFTMNQRLIDFKAICAYLGMVSWLVCCAAVTLCYRVDGSLASVPKRWSIKDKWTAAHTVRLPPSTLSHSQRSPLVHIWCPSTSLTIPLARYASCHFLPLHAQFLGFFQHLSIKFFLM